MHPATGPAVTHHHKRPRQHQHVEEQPKQHVLEADDDRAPRKITRRKAFNGNEDDCANDGADPREMRGSCSSRGDVWGKSNNRRRTLDPHDITAAAGTGTGTAAAAAAALFAATASESQGGGFGSGCGRSRDEFRQSDDGSSWSSGQSSPRQARRAILRKSNEHAAVVVGTVAAPADAAVGKELHHHDQHNHDLPKVKHEDASQHGRGNKGNNADPLSGDSSTANNTVELSHHRRRGSASSVTSTGQHHRQHDDEDHDDDDQSNSEGSQHGGGGGGGAGAGGVGASHGDDDQSVTTQGGAEFPSGQHDGGRTCVSCRKSKVKCSRGSPCDRCARLKLVCVAQTRGRGRPVASNKKHKFDSGSSPGSTSGRGSDGVTTAKATAAAEASEGGRGGRAAEVGHAGYQFMGGVGGSEPPASPSLSRGNHHTKACSTKDAVDHPKSKGGSGSGTTAVNSSGGGGGSGSGSRRGESSPFGFVGGGGGSAVPSPKELLDGIASSSTPASASASTPASADAQYTSSGISLSDSSDIHRGTNNSGKGSAAAGRTGGGGGGGGGVGGLPPPPNLPISSSSSRQQQQLQQHRLDACDDFRPYSHFSSVGFPPSTLSTQGIPGVPSARGPFLPLHGSGMNSVGGGDQGTGTKRGPIGVRQNLLGNAGGVSARGSEEPGNNTGGGRRNSAPAFLSVVSRGNLSSASGLDIKGGDSGNPSDAGGTGSALRGISQAWAAGALDGGKDVSNRSDSSAAVPTAAGLGTAGDRDVSDGGAEAFSSTMVGKRSFADVDQVPAGADGAAAAGDRRPPFESNGGAGLQQPVDPTETIVTGFWRLFRDQQIRLPKAVVVIRHWALCALDRRSTLLMRKTVNMARALCINVGEILNDYGIYAMFHDLLREAETGNPVSPAPHVPFEHRVEAPAYIQELASEFAAVSIRVVLRGQSCFYNNEMCRALFFSSEVANQMYAANKQDVWGTCIHPDDHALFFDTLSMQLFSVPSDCSEFIKILKCRDRMGVAFLALVHVRYEFQDGGNYAAFGLSMRPLPPSDYVQKVEPLGNGNLSSLTSPHLPLSSPASQQQQQQQHEHRATRDGTGVIAATGTTSPPGPTAGGGGGVGKAVPPPRGLGSDAPPPPPPNVSRARAGGGGGAFWQTDYASATNFVAPSSSSLPAVSSARSPPSSLPPLELEIRRRRGSFPGCGGRGGGDVLGVGGGDAGVGAGGWIPPPRVFYDESDNAAGGGGRDSQTRINWGSAGGASLPSSLGGQMLPEVGALSGLVGFRECATDRVGPGMQGAARDENGGWAAAGATSGAGVGAGTTSMSTPGSAPSASAIGRMNTSSAPRMKLVGAAGGALTSVLQTPGLGATDIGSATQRQTA